MATAAAGRQTRGRQRIPMRLIQSQDNLYASFSKRRLGLFKKGAELSTLCGVDLGIVVFSPTDNPFSFFSPNMDSVVEKYVNPDQPLMHCARALDAHARARIKDQNKRLDQLMDEKLKLKEKDAEIDRTRHKGWWEETPVESLTKEQVADWIAWFNNFKHRVGDHIQQQLQSADQVGGVPIHDQDGVVAAATATDQFNPSASSDHKSYYSSLPLDMQGRGESSQYFHRPPRSHYVSSPYGYFVAPGDQGGSSGGGGGEAGCDSGQYGSSTYMANPSSVGQHFQPENQPTSFFFSPHNVHICSGAQNLSTAGEKDEDAAGNSDEVED